VGETKKRFVAKAIPGIGWRIWNRKQAKWWGNPFSHHPEELLLELNGARRPDKIVELTKKN
jgi:hypothetical protein